MITPRPRNQATGLVGILALVAGDVVAAGQKGGERAARQGDEIVVAGQFHHTGTPVVTWLDPGGYDAYRVKRMPSESQDVKAVRPSNRYGNRTQGLSLREAERVRERGWDLEALRSVVDQFVIHYDAAGTSRRCFRVLHEERGLSVHFLLDLDGTVYQTLDLKEAAWHATVANPRSIGIEIANIGAFPVGGIDPFADWYTKGADGHTRLRVPGVPDRGGQRDRSADLSPRDEPVVGEIQGQTVRQYDLTPRQYESLIKLTATLCTLFPRITCDYPRGASGRLTTARLPGDALKDYHGLLGHYHVQADKIDPGPAFQWDKVVDGAKTLMQK